MENDNNPRAIYVTRPSLPPLAELLPYLESIWESRWLTNAGQFHREFERALARHLEVGHVALFNNATIALIVALQALEIGGEVVTTPFTFPATTHALTWNGIKPVFADIDEETFNLDPRRVREAVTSRTTAILPVHCYGTPCDCAALSGVAEESGLKLIYDAAHAFGVRVNGASLAAAGDLSVLSFHATKAFNTFEGGAIVCRDAGMKQRIDYLKNFGIADEVTVLGIGINGKMNEFQAALGLVQLRHVEAEREKRRMVDLYYREHLAGLDGVRMLRRSFVDEPNFSYFPILIGEGYGRTRDALHDVLRARGVYARRYFHPLMSELPAYRNLPSSAPENLPVATRVSKEILCLPIHTGLTSGDLERVVSIIRNRS